MRTAIGDLTMEMHAFEVCLAEWFYPGWGQKGHIFTIHPKRTTNMLLCFRAPHPSPLPAGEAFDELSRAETRPLRGERPLHSTLSPISARCSLSLRERAGVRGL